MFMKLKEIWLNHGFEICVGICLFFILIMALFRLGKKGSWNKYTIQRNKTLDSVKPRGDSKGEVECRRVLEKLFSKPFPKVRPDFLRNKVVSDLNLEIDCYNDELKIGCEYQGIQHYKYTPFFHRNKDAFQNQKYRDYLKRDLCEKNGVFLIEVPYKIKVENIESFIKGELKELYR